VSRWEREIDHLVYQLYELTDDEMATVEAASVKLKTLNESKELP